MFGSFIKTDNMKIYSLIIICSVAFIVFGAESYWYVSSESKGLTERKPVAKTKVDIKQYTCIELASRHVADIDYTECIGKISQSNSYYTNSISFYQKHLNVLNWFETIKDFESIFYGIMKANMFLKEEMLKIPQNYYYSVSDKTAISELQGEMWSSETQSFYNPHIGANMSDEEINRYVMFRFLKHTIVILGSFALFVAAANGLYRRFKAQREQQKILCPQICDTVELISVVNHQIKQPINTLLLVTSSIMDGLSKKRSLDTKDLIEKLKLSKKNILLINKTIDTFRNFYKLDSMVAEFELKSCVENILYIANSELVLSSITVQVDASNIKDLKIRSIENFIQQILLVLIQNAKEAILPLEVIKQLQRRRIEIRFETDDKFVHIFVSDFGEGISKDMEKMLFTKLKNSTKNKGGGMGLFFSKRLAKDSLKGDLTLISNAMPTTFKLTVARDICGKQRAK
ncbi:MAG: HAMP domain-containing histidine kinase [Campylobacteraceae bacterium]|jgi:signal transduction histidine kinase|nr:HAMP domain-containing histidine kinase [Campylobacteraceae bacterium]